MLQRINNLNLAKFLKLERIFIFVLQFVRVDFIFRDRVSTLYQWHISKFAVQKVQISFIRDPWTVLSSYLAYILYGAYCMQHTQKLCELKNLTYVIGKSLASVDPYLLKNCRWDILELGELIHLKISFLDLVFPSCWWVGFRRLHRRAGRILLFRWTCSRDRGRNRGPKYFQVHPKALQKSG